MEQARGVEGNREVSSEPSEFVSMRRPSGHTEWAVGGMSLEFRRRVWTGQVRTAMIGIWAAIQTHDWASSPRE